MQHKADLIGQGGAAAGAVGGELALVQLDQVLGLATRAVEGVIEPFRGAGGQVGDHAAYVEPQRRGLDPGRDPAFASPRLGAVAEFGIAPQHRHLFLGMPDADIVGGLVEQPAQNGIAGQAEDIVDGVGLAPRHHFGASVVAIAADCQLRGGPVATDAAHQAADMTSDLMSGRRLARSQQDGDGTRGGDIVDVDGHEAAFVW